MARERSTVRARSRSSRAASSRRRRRRRGQLLGPLLPPLFARGGTRLARLLLGARHDGAGTRFGVGEERRGAHGGVGHRLF